MKATLLTGLGALKYLGNRKEKGKQPALAAPTHYDYGSSAQTPRSGDVLDRVVEVDDAAAGDVFPWDVDQTGEEENWNDAEDVFVRDIYAYRRTYRLFAIVPFFSILLFVVLALLPTMIWPRKPWLPQQDPPRLFAAFLLSAALWSLSYVLRVPSHRAVSFVLSKIAMQLHFYIGLDSIISFTHTVLFVFMQELLRLSSFVILSLHWHRFTNPLATLDDLHFYARDAVFREVWFIGLAWAAAEVGAGIAQGYENLSLYDEEALFGVTEVYEDGFGNGIKLGSPMQDNDIDERPGSKSSIDRLLDCRPCAPSDMSERSIDLDNAITQLTNVKAREDLEEVFGMPFIDVPVFITLLQRVDSYILSMALTLLLALAYLPSPVDPSSMSIQLWPTFFMTASAHAVLALIHTPSVLSRVSLPAAAYIACLISLGMLFGGVGLWVGLWG